MLVCSFYQFEMKKVLTPEEEIEFKKWWNEDETAKLWRAKYEETMGMAPMGGPSKSDCMFKVQWKKGWRPDPNSDNLVSWVPEPGETTPLGCFWMFTKYPAGFFVTGGICLLLNKTGLFEDWSSTAQLSLVVGIFFAWSFIHSQIQKGLEKK